MRFVFIILCLIATFFSFSQADSLHVSRYLPKKFGVYPYKGEITKSEYELNEELKKYPYMQDELGKVSRNPNYIDSLKKYRLKNFNALFQLNLSFETIYKHNDLFNEEIPPFIDTVPDGIYVRYFNAYPYPDVDTIKFDKNRIYSIFSIKNNVSDGMSYWFTPDSQLLYKQGGYQNAMRINSWRVFISRNENNFSCQNIIQKKYTSKSNVNDSIEIIYDQVFPSGKHQIKYQEFGSKQTCIYFDSILLFSKTDRSFEIFNWKIEPEDSSFKAIIENRFLVESGLFADVPIMIESYSTWNYFFPDIQWKEYFLDSYIYSLINSFSLENSYDGFLCNPSKIDPITGDEIYNYSQKIDFSEYHSFYSPEKSFIQLTTKNGKTHLVVFDTLGNVLFSKIQLDTNQIRQILGDKAGAFISNNHLFFVENDFNWYNDSRLYASLYSYQVDTTCIDDSSSTWYSFDLKQTGMLDVSENMNYSDSILIDGFVYHPYYFSKNNEYYFQENSKRDLKENKLHLIYSCYDTTTKKITKQVKINFIEKELEAKLFDIKECQTTHKIKMINDKLLSFIQIQNKNGVQINIDSLAYNFDDFKKILEGNIVDSTFLYLSEDLVKSIFNGGFFIENPYNPTSTYIGLTENLKTKYAAFSLCVNDKPINGTLKLDANRKKTPIYLVNDSIIPITFFDLYNLLYEVNGIKYHNPITPILASYDQFNRLYDYSPTASEIAIVNGKLTGEFRIYNRNKQIIQQFNLRDNLIEGQITKYDFKTKKYYKELNFVRGKLEGKIKSGRYTTYYKNGVKEGVELFQRARNYYDTTYYKHGLLHGRNVQYQMSYPDKTIEKTISYYANDLLDGKRIRIRIENSSKVDTLEISHFKNGKWDGLSVWYDNRLNTYDKIEYKESIINGSFERFLKDGNIRIFKGNFSKGKLDGNAYYYYPNGNIYAKVKYLNGSFVDSVLFYDTLSNLKARHILSKDRFLEKQLFKNGKLYSRLTVDTTSINKEKDSTFKLPSYVNEFLIYNYNYKYSEFPYKQDILPFEDIYNQNYYSNELKFKYTCYENTSLLIGNGQYAYSNYFSINEDGYALQKIGVWKYKSKEKGQYPYQIEYRPKNLNILNNTLDTILLYPSQKITLFTDSVFKDILSEKYVIENTSLYNCGDKETYEINTYYVAYEKDSSMHLRNGYQKNYYPNGVLQSEGMNKAGLPTGGWKFYNDNGSLREAGNYKDGKRVGRWLAGDLSKINYLGDICMDMNDPRNVVLQKELENQLDIEEAFYESGDVVSRNYLRVKR